MWNPFRMNPTGPTGGQSRNFGNFANVSVFPGSFLPVETNEVMLKILTKPINGFPITNIVSQKKFVNPNFVNKQNPNLHNCQNVLASNDKINSNLIGYCTSFLNQQDEKNVSVEQDKIQSAPSEKFTNSHNQQDDHHFVQLQNVCNELIKTQPEKEDVNCGNIPRSQPVNIANKNFSNLVNSESLKETMCRKGSPKMGTKGSKNDSLDEYIDLNRLMSLNESELSRNVRSCSPLKRTKNHVLDCDPCAMRRPFQAERDLDELKDLRRDLMKTKLHKHSKIDESKLKNMPKKFTKQSFNERRRKGANAKYCEKDLLDELYFEEDEDEYSFPIPDDFKVVQKETLHMKRDGEDVQFIVGPFVDKEDALKFMKRGEPKEDVAVGREVPSNSPTLTDACIGLVKKLACSPVTVKVSGGNKNENYNVKFNPTQPCDDPEDCSCGCAPERQRNFSECSDDFIVFEDDDHECYESGSCCSDDQSSTADCECSDVDDDSVQFEEPDNASSTWGCNCNSRPTPPRMNCCNMNKQRKKVTFNDSNLCTVHPMIKWSYAYQAARKGPWEMYARDRSRFQERVCRSANTLNKVLDPAHRCRVYQTRFYTD